MIVGMRLHLPKINQFVQNISGWLAVLGALSAFFSWLGKKIALFGPLGWPEAIFLGVGSACIVTLVISAGLVAWRYFQPIKAGPQSPPARPLHVSTPELRQQLEASIASVEARLRRSIAELGDQFSANEKMVKIHCQNLDDAHVGQISQIRKEVTKVLDGIKADDLDLKHILYFTELQATAALLGGLISEVPHESIPLGDNVNEDHREDCFKLHDRYIEHVLRQLGGTIRGSSARSVLALAENEAEAKIRQLPEIERPRHIDVLDLRRFEIVSLKCERLTSYLRHELDETIGDIRNQRSNLIQQRQRRSPS